MVCGLQLSGFVLATWAPKRPCTLKALWLAQQGNYPLAPPVHNIGISNGPSQAMCEKT